MIKSTRRDHRVPFAKIAGQDAGNLPQKPTKREGA